MKWHFFTSKGTLLGQICGKVADLPLLLNTGLSSQNTQCHGQTIVSGKGQAIRD